MSNKTFTKVAHAQLTEQLKKVAAEDSTNAFEVGFAKAAQDAGLTEAQYNAVRQIALAKIAAARK